MIKAVIFDWAGTTIDYGCFAPVQALISGFKSVGIEISTEMVRKPMGLPKFDHIKAISTMLDRPLSEKKIIKVYKVFEKILLNDIEKYCDLKDYVLDVVAELKQNGIKIGSTTGYTSLMMEKVLAKSMKQGYHPDFCIAPDQVERGRPHPDMILKNLKQFSIHNSREVVKVGDTIVDITEGKNAGCWTVGVIIGSSELGLSRDEFNKLTSNKLETKKNSVRKRYFRAKADFVIDDLNDLKKVLEDINKRV